MINAFSITQHNIPRKNTRAIYNCSKLMTKPRFNKNQLVCFAGGAGTIIGYKPESGRWIYAVEMEMGPEPPMGRIGAETRLLLDEIEIQAAID